MSNIQETETRKKLKSQLDKEVGELTALNLLIAGKKKEYNTKKDFCNKLQQQIKELDNPETPTISEHALLRYFERVKGFDLQKIREEILSENILKQIKTLGKSGTYANKNYQVVIRNNVVVTIKIKNEQL